VIIDEVFNQRSKSAPSSAAEITDLSKIVAFRRQLMHNYVSLGHEMVWGVAHASLLKLLSA
jgi:uncharacterized protein with HEPN domain